MMEQDLINLLPEYFTVSGVASQLGVTRPAIADALKRGSIQQDAYLVEATEGRTPLFKQATIDAYRSTSKGKPGRKPGLPGMKGRRGVLVTDPLYQVTLNLETQRMLMPGLEAGISSLNRWIAYSGKHDLASGALAENRERLAKVLEITKREIEEGRSVSDRVSAETLGLLRAAMELSARAVESEMKSTHGLPTSVIEQMQVKVSKMRAAFSHHEVPPVDVQLVLREWGFDSE